MRREGRHLFWNYFGVIFFVALALSIPSIWVNFFPSEGWVLATGLVSIIPAVASLFFIFSSRAKKRIEGAPNPRLLRKGQWVLGIGSPISMFVLTWLATSQLAGYGVTALVGEPYQQQTIGTLEASLRRVTGCSRFVRIAEIPGHWGDRLCVSRPFFDALPSVSTVTLRGQRSPLGFRVVAYDR